MQLLENCTNYFDNAYRNLLQAQKISSEENLLLSLAQALSVQCTVLVEYVVGPLMRKKSFPEYFDGEKIKQAQLRFLQSVNESCNRILEIKLDSISELQSQAKENLKKLPDLEQRVKSGVFFSQVTSAEKKAIFQAMGKDVGTGNGGFGGHWYQCANGHVYTIGECGGAMQQSRCPECGVVVGGQSHRLAQGNSTASDFLREVQQ